MPKHHTFNIIVYMYVINIKIWQNANIAFKSKLEKILRNITNEYHDQEENLS